MNKPRVKMTNILAAAIKQARQGGMTELATAHHFGVSTWTVRFYSSDINQEKMRGYERARYQRVKALRRPE